MSVFQRRLRDGKGNYLTAPDGQPLREKEYTTKFDWQGKTVTRKTGKFTAAEAQVVETKLLRELKSGRIDDILDHLRARADRTLAHLIAEYKSTGCPNAELQPRTGPALERELALLDQAALWWADKHPDKINPGHSLQYLNWRKTTLTKKNCAGKRTAELELQTIANLFTWALKCGHIDQKPALQLRFRAAKEIRHAREGMPADADEIHRTAAWFFLPRAYPSATLESSSPSSSSSTRARDHRKHVFGWLKLFLPLTGLRTGEARMLLAHPKLRPGRPDPGYTDDTYLHVHREKRGCNPRIRLDDPQRPHIRPLLELIRQWHAAYYPASIWLFPGRAGEQLDKDSYRKAYAQARAALHIDHRWPHADRAYYTSVRLAQGADIEEIARELGQRSPEELVRDVYGLDLDSFNADTFKSLADKLTWLPSQGEPAWTWWTNPQPNIIPLQATA